MDFHLLQGPFVWKWWLIVLANRGAVIHADIKAFGSETSTEGLVDPSLSDFLIVDEDRGSASLADAAIVFKLHANDGGAG